jgi:hypothetical protein
MKHEDPGSDAALRAVAERLGRAAAERVDVERTAERVVARLREDARRARQLRRWLEPTGLRIAAALVIVAGAGLVARGLWRASPGQPVAAESTTGELAELSAAQLRELLGTVDRPAADQDVVLAQDVDLDDLSAAQLRALLASLEGTAEWEG